jgi:hypothetical protein
MTKILNPLIRKLAGRGHFRMAAQIRHVGRRSGRPYVTPAGARLHGDAIVIPLTFGNRSEGMPARSIGEFVLAAVIAGIAGTWPSASCSPAEQYHARPRGNARRRLPYNHGRVGVGGGRPDASGRVPGAARLGHRADWGRPDETAVAGAVADEGPSMRLHRSSSSAPVTGWIATRTDGLGTPKSIRVITATGVWWSGRAPSLGTWPLCAARTGPRCPAEAMSAARGPAAARPDFSGPAERVVRRDGGHRRRATSRPGRPAMSRSGIGPRRCLRSWWGR